MVIKIVTLGYVGFFVVAGINHFINPIFYDKIVPDFIPFPRFVHLFTGVIEIILPLFFFTSSRNIRATGGILIYLIYRKTEIAQTRTTPTEAPTNKLKM